MEPAAALEDGRAAAATAAPTTQPSQSQSQPGPATATAPQPQQEGLLSRLNDFLNEDYVYDIAYYGFWATFWLFAPYAVLLALAGMALYDACTAKVRSILPISMPHACVHAHPKGPNLTTTTTPHPSRATARPAAPSS